MRLQFIKDQSALTVKYEENSEKYDAELRALEQRVKTIEEVIKLDSSRDLLLSGNLPLPKDQPLPDIELKRGAEQPEIMKSLPPGSNYVVVKATWVYLVVPFLIAVVVILGLMLALKK